MNKKILVSLSVIAAVAAVVVGATTAYFSDTETSTGNTFTAGAIDLKIDNESYYNGELSQGTSWDLRDLTNELFFNFADLKPGDWGEDTVSLHVNNNPAWGCVEFYGLEDNDNDCTEPETADGDTTCGDQEGELSGELEFVFWADVCDECSADPGDNIYQPACDLLLARGQANEVLGGATYTLAAPGYQNVFTGVLDEPLNGDETYYIGKLWCFGELVEYENGQIVCDGSVVDNVSQSDSLVGNVKFYVEQSRNNLRFTCKGEVCVPQTMTLFSDDFESGDFSSWNSHTGSWSVENNPSVAHGGSYYALSLGIVGDEGQIVKAVSTADRNNVTLSYYYRVVTGYALESSDHVYVEYSSDGGATWTEIRHYTNMGSTSGWVLETINLPAGADEEADFQFRFRSNMYAESGDAMKFDDVLLTGDTICPTDN